MPFDIDAFSCPPSSMRPMPLWTWNGKMTPERVLDTIRQFHERGLGGFFIHPRPGLINEYLSDEWFELWNCALQEAKRLGLECNLYDEDTYPSGYGGGHVADRAPETTASYLVAQLVLPGEKIPAPEETIRIEELPHSNAKLFILIRKADCTPWTAWHPPIDTMNPLAAKTFLEVTHKAYADCFASEFGQSITHVFSDEPTWMMRDVRCREERSLPFTPVLFEEFRAEHGYSLEERIADLFVPGEAGQVTRYDYFSTLQRIWLNNFLRPIYEWCEQHHLKYTGHFMEHEWPLPLNQGSTMDAMRWMQTPGIDLLAFQYHFSDPSKNDWMLLNIKEAASVARQLGRQRVLCESHGGGGHHLQFNQFKELTDWAMIHGINLINPHMSDQSIAGARKFDWPQTLSDHSPWWDEYRLYTDHTARMTAALTQGTIENRTLVLHPSTSAWLHFIPEDVDGVFNEPITALRHSQCSLIQMLADRQIDFDLGNELLMRDYASVESGKMRIGQALYDHVVLPENTETWCESTLALMWNYLQSGGVLLALGKPPERINGRKDPRAGELRAAFPENWIDIPDHQALHRQIIRRCPPRITRQDGTPLPACIHHHFRTLENGDHLHGLVNANHFSCEFTLHVAGRSLKQLNTFDGSICELPSIQTGGRVYANVTLPETGHLLFISSANPAGSIATETPCVRDFQQTGPIESITRTEPNLLTVDYCDITFRGQTLRDKHVMDADLWIWQQLGFPRNIWDWAIQFKNSYSQYRFDDTTGFSIDYRFTAEASAETLNGIELAIERPQLYRISVNGNPVDFSPSVEWFDHEIRRIAVGAHLKNGENVIRLETDRFNIFCEIAQIYLRGEFATRPAARGFSIIDPQPLTPGDWVQNGLHFYRGNMIYQTSIEIPEDAKQLTLRLPEWNGALCRVRLGVRNAGSIAFPPYELTLPCPEAGKIPLEIEVIGTLRNLLGSHYCDGIPSRWSWENHPATQPPGTAYRFVPQGLTGPVEYAISNNNK